MHPADLAPALPWLAPYLLFARLRHVTPSLEEHAPDDGARVSVIIPARDEAANIEACVRSVLASTHALHEVVVVDDRSSDGTAELVATLAAADPRVRLVRGAKLPEGWYGKPWACQQGAAVATGELLCFTDADTRHGPELLGRAVAFGTAAGADLVTVAPHQRCDGFWERVVQPHFWLLLGYRYHASVINRATRRRDAIANGQFILLSRATYDAIGGHAAVRDEVAEDVALAQRVVASSRRVRIAYALDRMETRMYSSLAEIVRGWGKNVYLGGRRTFPDEPLLRALVPVLFVLGFGFWLGPAIGLGTALARGTPWAGWALAFAVASAFWAVIYWGMRLPWRYALLHPLGALVALYIALASAVRGTRRVEWRGRVYGATINRA